MIYLFIILVFALVPFFRFKYELRKRKKEFQKKFRELEIEEKILEKEDESLKKKIKEISEELKHYEKLYEISKNMEKITEIKELAKSFIEIFSLEFNLKKIAFFDSNLGFVCSKGIDANEIEKFNPESIEEKLLKFPVLIKDKVSAFIVGEGEVSKEKNKLIEIILSQISLLYEKAKLYLEVENLSRIDGLTKLFLRRYFNQRFKEEILRAKRYNYIIGFLMCDIDNFKHYNDTYGHQMGDRILEKVAKEIKENIDPGDFAGRFGGEEFSIFIPAKEKKEVIDKAERIRSAIEKKTKVTVSIGVSFYPFDAEDIDEIVKKADKSLYKAKREGKNKVIVYKEPR